MIDIIYQLFIFKAFSFFVYSDWTIDFILSFVFEHVY